MKVICKLDGCPAGLDICCSFCKGKDFCEDRCRASGDLSIYKTCPDAEIVNEIATFESAVPDTIEKITTLLKLKKQLDEQEKELKQKLVEAMEAYDVKSFENDQIKMTYVAPTTRSTIDSTRLKKDHPDIAEQYNKTSNVSASVRVTVK